MTRQSRQKKFVVSEITIELDEDGFMINRQQWSPEVATALAEQNNLRLTDAHWEIIQFVRQYHDTYSIEPPMRALVKAVKERFGEGMGNSRYLYKLFPDGPAKEACRYAGLPKPVSCI